MFRLAFAILTLCGAGEGGIRPMKRPPFVSHVRQVKLQADRRTNGLKPSSCSRALKLSPFPPFVSLFLLKKKPCHAHAPIVLWKKANICISARLPERLNWERNLNCSKSHAFDWLMIGHKGYRLSSLSPSLPSLYTHLIFIQKKKKRKYQKATKCERTKRRACPPSPRTAAYTASLH